MAGGGGAEVRKAGGAASACARGERSTRGPLQSQRVREGEGGRGGEGEANRHGERWHRNARVLRLARPRERAQRRSHRRVRTELLPQHPVHHEGVAIAPSRQELVHAVQSRSERVRLTNNEQNKESYSVVDISEAKENTVAVLFKKGGISWRNNNLHPFEMKWILEHNKKDLTKKTEKSFSFLAKSCTTSTLLNGD